jgi:hypothetical protein
MRKSALRSLATLIVLLAIASLRGQNTTATKEVQDFEIQGSALFECQCPDHGCPCQKNGRPTHGTCYGSDFAHIKTGHYGGIKLDGLNMGFVGDLVDANSDRMFATLYVDQKATPAQGEALTHIFEYVNGAYIALAGQPPPPYAENIQYEYHDPELGKGWDYSGHYANVKYFRLTKKMYAEQKMLCQHGDMSGTWTPKQLEIIRQAGSKIMALVLG